MVDASEYRPCRKWRLRALEHSRTRIRRPRRNLAGVVSVPAFRRGETIRAAELLARMADATAMVVDHPPRNSTRTSNSSSSSKTTYRSARSILTCWRTSTTSRRSSTMVSAIDLLPKSAIEALAAANGIDPNDITRATLWQRRGSRRALHAQNHVARLRAGRRTKNRTYRR